MIAEKRQKPVNGGQLPEMKITFDMDRVQTTYRVARRAKLHEDMIYAFHKDPEAPFWSNLDMFPPNNIESYDSDDELTHFHSPEPYRDNYHEKTKPQHAAGRGKVARGSPITMGTKGP